jgi:hypothetical protein
MSVLDDSNSNIEVKITTQRPKVGDKIELEITGADENTELTYKWYINDEETECYQNYYIPTKSDYENWIEVGVFADEKQVASDKIFFSKLPVVYIDTDDGEAITSYDDVYKSASMYIQGGEEYDSQYSGNIEIKVRGKGSRGYDKKPYKIKLDKKTDLFGFGKNKHWVLLANYLDQSLMRNTAAYKLSAKLGLVNTETTWVDVVLNGSFVGNYQLCEHIRIGESRVNIFDWEDEAEKAADKIYEKVKQKDNLSEDDEKALETYMQENLSWVTSGIVTYNGKDYRVSDYYKKVSSDISGGYLFELSEEYGEVSKFTTTSGRWKVMLSKPEFLYTNNEMMSYVEDYWNAYDDAVHSLDGYNSDGKHYTELADINSMASYWLTMEIMGNHDAIWKSRYAYKDTEGLLIFGPVWDFDWAAGTVGLTILDSVTTGWKISKSDNNQDLYKDWIDDPYFVVKAQQKYWEIHSYLESLVSDEGILESYYEYLKESGEANWDLWSYERNSLLTNLTDESDNYSRDFDEDYTALKDYLTVRIEWLDEQFETQESIISSLYTKYSTNPYTRSNDKLEITLSNAVDDILSEKAPADGLIAESEDVSVSVKVNDEETVKLSVYVNGLKAGEYSVEDAECNFTVDADKLTEEIGDKNVISIIGHSSNEDVSNEDVTYTNFVSVIVTEGKHAYSKPEFVWNDDKTACTAKFTCIGEDCEGHDHDMESDADITKETIDADCVNDGKIKYKATVTLDNGKTYTDTKEEKVSDKLEHEYGEPKFKWNNDKTKCSAVFECKRYNCKKTVTGHTKKLSAEVEKEETEADCVNDGKIEYKAKVTLEGTEYEDTKEEKGDNKLGHKYGEPKFTWNEDKTECSAVFECERDNCEETADGHTKELSAEVEREEIEADCVNDGKIEYKAKVTLEGTEYEDTKEEKGDNKLGHKYGEPKFSWNEDKTECSVSFICDREGCADTTEGHLVQISAEVETSKTSDGKTVHTAKAVFNDVEYTDTVEETPAEEPSEEPSTPSEEPSTPSEEPSTPSEEPSTPSEEPSTPSEEPSTPSEEPSTPSEEPSTPSEETSTPDDTSSEQGLNVSFASPDAEYTYTGNAITPKVVVTCNGNILAEGTDYSIKYTNNVNASAKSRAKITVTGKNNLSGTKTLWFDIKPKNIGDEDVITGNIIVSPGSKAVPVLIYNNEVLTSKSYSVSDKNKKYYSDSTAVVTGRDNFTGTREIPVSVVDKSGLKKFSVNAGKEKLTYNGEQQRISYEVTDKDTGARLQENTDYYTVYPENTTDAGTVRFTVVGMGSYSGSVTKSYRINPTAVKSGISVDRPEPDKEYPYVSTGVTINDDLVVTYTSNDKSETLTEGKDYRVSYTNNKKAGQAKYTVSFIGNYKGTRPISGSFTIKAYGINNDSQGLKIATVDKIYTKPGTYRSKIYVSLNGKMLKSSDYKVYYYTDEAMTKEAGSTNKITLDKEQAYATVYVKAVGKGNYEGSIMTATYKVWNKSGGAVDISNARVTVLSADNRKLTKTEYTGKEICPEIKVEVKQNGKYVVVPSDQYEVSYIGNIEKGKATVTVNALGEQYAGAASANFTITSKNLGK